MSSRLVHTEPITDDDDLLRVALETTSVPALIASVVHLTGDPSVLRGPMRPRKFINNEFQGAMTAEELTELRQVAFDAVVAFRDAGSPPPPVPPEPVLRELMDWIACEHVPDEYAELFLEEMDLHGSDPRRIEIDGDASAISVLVIGCGMSGLLAGVRLKQAGIPFEIIEKNDDVGGTWYENDYPGCRVDVANHYYCYSFEPNHGFTEYYAQQPELHAYFRDVMARHGVAEHVRWRTEVERAELDDEAKAWRVTTRDGDGHRQVRTATAIISGVGQLNRPFVPNLPGLDEFAGPAFHSARWDHSVDLRGKRVALVGAGASGFQIGPDIADDVEHLTVFQRTAQWVSPNARYHEAVPPGAVWAMRHLPGYARWYRFILLWQASDKMLEVARVDPEWPGLPQSANQRSELVRQMIVSSMEALVGGDPDLLAKVTPDYPPLGKRMLQDDGTWFRTLLRHDVELVRDDIVRVEPDAIVTADGRRHEVDVIVLATGFEAQDFLAPIEVVGRGGRSLHDAWAGRPAAYLGITVPDFPNLFLMYGPGTNLAHAGSVIFHAECQMRYVGECLALLAAQGGGAIEPTREAFDGYVERLQAALRETVWAHPSVKHSWYKHPDGNVYVLSPWRLVDYWKMTERPVLGEHVVRP